MVIPILLIIVYYVQIVCSVLKVSSACVFQKTFSTCGSHLSVVSLFYGTSIGVYVFPSANNNTVKETSMTIICTVVIPVLIPFLYSLKNRGPDKSFLQKENLFIMATLGYLLKFI